MAGSDGHHGAPGADAFVKMWSDMASSMARAGTMFSPTSSPPQVMRQIQSDVLSAWADYFDRFARSDEFRSAMRQALSTTVESRRQLNELLGRTQHELQGASRQDVDQLMLSLRHVERRVVDAAERLSTQLESLDKRLTRLENRLRKQDREPKGAPKKGGKRRANEKQ